MSEQKTNKKMTGIMGGSFDPIHLAHVKLAKSAFEQMHLDEIFFIPARQAPLRDAPVQTLSKDRLAMLQIAISKFPYPCSINLCEMQNDGISYSIDTARYLNKNYPDRDFYWIIGSDHIAKLKSWKNINELSKLVKFICAVRPDFDINLNDIPPYADVKFINFSPDNCSSTIIRKELKYRKFPNLMLDQDVYNYILKNHLYNT